MEALNDILKQLICPLCSEYMVTEIPMCSIGHCLCKKCKTVLNNKCPTCSNDIVSRNTRLETISSNIQYPCRKTGCQLELKPGEIREHELSCEFGKFDCPFKKISNCPFTINVELGEIKTHIESDHKDTIDRWTSLGPYQIRVTFFGDRTFLIFGQFGMETTYFSAMYVGGAELSKKYSVKATFIQNDQQHKGFGYKLEACASCIPLQDNYEDVFNGDKIVVGSEMLKMFIKNDYQFNDGFTIIEKVKVNA